MEIKKTVRSEHYGKVIAYDEQGRMTDEVDILAVKVQHEGKEYKVGELLEKVVDLENRLKTEEEFTKLMRPEIQDLRKKVLTLSKLAVNLDAKIKLLEVRE